MKVKNIKWRFPSIYHTVCNISYTTTTTTTTVTITTITTTA